MALTPQPFTRRSKLKKAGPFAAQPPGSRAAFKSFAAVGFKAPNAHQRSAIGALQRRRTSIFSDVTNRGARVVLEALVSLEHLSSQEKEALSEPELLKRVGAALVEKGEERSSQQVAPEQQWQALMEQGLQHKTRLLASPEFRNTAEAGKLLGVGEAAIRKRIRSGTLFALRVPGGDERRIPLWALDPALANKVTGQLLREGADLDEWAFYSFMTTPHGRLHGLRPFEALVPVNTLGPEQKAARKELAEQLQLSASASLLSAVRDALRMELEDRPQS